LTDHSLALAWDANYGGFWDEGNSWGGQQRHEPGKIWWAQAEGLNTLLLMYARTGELRYWQDFLKIWNYIRTYGIDEQEGGWRFSVNPLEKSSHWKVHPTKAAYHSGRAMLNVVDQLRRLAEDPSRG
jgi:mannobiose 2-epimerase